MAASNVVVFDMDGVLVDTVPALRDAYGAFARAHGFEPTDGEFDRLNGPTLQELVEDLRRRHGLPDPHAALLQRYEALIDRAYAGVRALPGVLRLLEGFRDSHLPLAVASSASRRRV